MQLGTSHSLSSDREEESECMPSYRTLLNAFPAPLDDKAYQDGLQKCLINIKLPSGLKIFK